MKLNKKGHLWVVAYINRKFVQTVDQDLISKGYPMVTAYIPMVRILKRRFKNKREYEEIPFLFNYGFFQLPNTMVYNPTRLSSLQRDIPAIVGWLKDHSRILYDEDADNTIGIHNISIVSPREVRTIRRSCRASSIFNDLEVDSLGIGQEINLKGYPFDGLTGTVVRVDKPNSKIELDILSSQVPLRVTVDFENIFYTVYEEYEEGNSKEDSLEDIYEKGPRIIDKLFATLNTEEDGGF